MAYIGNTPDVNTFAAGTDNFNGDNTKTTFTLTRRVTGVNDVIAVIENVIQNPFTAYTIAANNTSGTADITFASPPPSGTGNIQVRFNFAQIVTFDVIDGGNILGGTVTGAKLANTAVTPGIYGSGDGTQIPQITVDAQGRITSASNTALAEPELFPHPFLFLT
jgi:hypothetical protein